MNELKPKIMNDKKEIMATKPKSKGLGSFFRLFLIIPYISTLISLALFIIALLELFNITGSDFVSGFVALDFGISFAILAIVTRIYYKMFRRD